jgi:MFS family permease
MTVKSELSFGIPVLIAAFIGMAIGINSLYFYTSGLFIKPLQEEFEWTRSAISSVNFFGALLSAGIAPFVGALTDRLGVRIVAGVCLLLFSCSFYLLSGVSGFTEFFIFSLILQLVGTGTGPIVFSRLINQYFDKARGFALGLTLAGTGVASTLAPRFLAGHIEDSGWREAYEILALIVIVFTPVVIFLARERSKDITNTNQQEKQTTNIKSNFEYGTSLDEARRSTTFWLLGVLFLIVSIAIGGLIMHLVPLLTDADVPLKKAASIAGVLGLSVVVSRIGIGLLLDRFFAPRVALILFFLTAVGLVLLAFGGPKFAIIAAICIGCSIGGETDLIAFFTAKYFGIRSYGKIYGLLYAMFMVGMSISAFLTGFIFDSFGSYFVALLTSTFLLLIACVICSWLPKYPEFNKDYS